MAKILLNLICATITGSCDLFIKSAKGPTYTFAYGNINYSRYLTVMFGEMERLQIDKPDVYQEFNSRNFEVQLSESSISMWTRQRNDHQQGHQDTGRHNRLQHKS